MANPGPAPECPSPDLYVYVVDASDDAASDDFGGAWDDACGGSSRLDIQRGLLLPADTSDTPGELCLALRGATVKVALVVTAHGKATVALCPTTDAAALKDTLRDVHHTPGATGGASNLRAALCLALLVARGASNPKITAFVAGPVPGFDKSDAEDVRSRAGAAALSVCVLAPRGEVGDAAAAVMEILPCGGGNLRWLPPPAAPESGASAEDEYDKGTSEEELWVLKEASGADTLAVKRPEPAQTDSAAAVPPLAPRSTPAAPRATAARGPLARSAFSCRESSLDTLLHLSRSGLLRQKLPTYSTLAGRVRGAAPATGNGLSPSAGDCYVRVLAQPRYRTLVRLDVGRWCNPNRPNGPSASWAPGALRIVQDLKTPSALLVVCSVDAADPSNSAAGSLSLKKPSTAADAPLDLWATPSSLAAALADLRVSVPETPPQNPVTHENFEYWVSGGASPFQVAFPLLKGATVAVRDLTIQDSEGKTRTGRLVSFIMPIPATATTTTTAAAAAAAASGGETSVPRPATQRQCQGKPRFNVWVPAPEGYQEAATAQADDPAAAAAAAAPEVQAAVQGGTAFLLTRALRCTIANLDAAASGLLFISPFLFGFTTTLTTRLMGSWRAQATKQLEPNQIPALNAPQAESAAPTPAAAAAPATLLPVDCSAFFGLSSVAAEAALCGMVSVPPAASLTAVVAALRAAGLLAVVATVGPLDAASVALMLRHQAAAAEQQGQQAAWDALKDRVAAPPGAPQAAADAAAAGSPQFLFRGSVPQQHGASASDNSATAVASNSLQHVTHQEAQAEGARDAAAAGLEVDSTGPGAVLVAKAGEEEVKLPLTPSAARDPTSLSSAAGAPPPPPSD